LNLRIRISVTVGIRKPSPSSEIPHRLPAIVVERPPLRNPSWKLLTNASSYTVPDRCPAPLSHAEACAAIHTSFDAPLHTLKAQCRVIRRHMLNCDNFGSFPCSPIVGFSPVRIPPITSAFAMPHATPCARCMHCACHAERMPIAMQSAHRRRHTDKAEQSEEARESARRLLPC